MSIVKFSGLAALLAAAFAPVPVSAQQSPIKVEAASPQARVSFGDLNLATPDGIKALESRVRSAAADLCLADGVIGLEERMARQRCYRTAIAGTLAQVEQAVGDFGRTRYAGGQTITVSAR